MVVDDPCYERDRREDEGQAIEQSEEIQHDENCSVRQKDGGVKVQEAVSHLSYGLPIKLLINHPIILNREIDGISLAVLDACRL